MKILNKLRSLYREKIEGRTVEWEEDDVPEGRGYSKYAIIAKAKFIDRLKFLFTNNLVYRLTKNQFNVISRNPMKENK